VRPVTVAATQFACGWDADANLDRAESLVRDAAARGAQVILLQELFETPYFCIEQDVRHLRLATPLDQNAAVRRLRPLARELGVVLPVSFFEKANNAYFNSVAIVDADGPATRRRPISARATPGSASGIPAMHASASASAGTSGFRNARARWR
jgi:N-carbamoylputrescine amidase